MEACDSWAHANGMRWAVEKCVAITNREVGGHQLRLSGERTKRKRRSGIPWDLNKIWWDDNEQGGIAGQGGVENINKGKEKLPRRAVVAEHAVRPGYDASTAKV